jgi:hypothetical protein
VGYRKRLAIYQWPWSVLNKIVCNTHTHLKWTANNSLQGINEICHLLFYATSNICKKRSTEQSKLLWRWYSIRRSENTPYFCGKKVLMLTGHKDEHVKYKILKIWLLNIKFQYSLLFENVSKTNSSLQDLWAKFCTLFRSYPHACCMLRPLKLLITSGIFGKAHNLRGFSKYNFLSPLITLVLIPNIYSPLDFVSYTLQSALLIQLYARWNNTWLGTRISLSLARSHSTSCSPCRRRDHLMELEVVTYYMYCKGNWVRLHFACRFAVQHFTFCFMYNTVEFMYRWS